MAFHVACPITCRKICFCELGFSVRLQSKKGKNDFLREVGLVERFLNDPWLVKGRESNATVQVKVPKVVVAQAPPPYPPQGGGVGGGRGGEDSVKRVVLLNQAAAASVVPENDARRVGSGGDLALASAKYDAEEEQNLSNVKVTCQLCFAGENEGTENARKMLPCSSCGKKYHRNCLKSWSKNRDLFHWSQWICPSCRICEVCRKTGDPSKFMFCKRCDGAYHCYCQHPPHKNVGHGPYLCPKHTKCHGCGSTVPGNGLSVRWFLGYTCCDACGRLFVKSNYCPVCLKVYRDSESTPMVCCDICQRWVHLPCDGISDAKYMQFQVDGNLQYTCPTCRGECSQIRSLEEAVQELWRRRDEADKDLIVSLRAAAGLPTQEEIFDISPFSDDEESGPIAANECSRSLKFSLKGLGDSSPRKSKEFSKKSSNKKHGKKRGSETSEQFGSPRIGASNKNEDLQLSGAPVTSSPVVGNFTEGVSSVNETAVPKHKYVDEVMPTNVPKTARTIKIKSNKFQSLTNKEEIGSNSGVPKSSQGPKLVIHLGGRNRSMNSPSRSEASTQKGAEDASPLKHHDSDRHGTATKHRDQKGHQVVQLKGLRPREKEGHVLKLKNSNSEVSGSKPEVGGGHESQSPSYPTTALGKRGAEEGLRSESEAPITKRTRQSSMKHAEDGSASTGLNEDTVGPPQVAQASATDRKPFLKFKIPRNSNDANQSVSTRSNNGGNQSSVSLPGKEEITYTRGQRSKRRRPALADEESSQGLRENNAMAELMDANWILQKLGKDASGKRVEIHHPSDDSWHRGTVVEVFEDTSKVSIALDDGTAKSYELGKQGIRFVSQKQKH